MRPSTKATIALPFVVGLIAFVLSLAYTHPALFIYLLLFISVCGILGAIWYALYTSFGGKI
jgi:hypothetical protein